MENKAIYFYTNIIKYSIATQICSESHKWNAEKESLK